MMSRRWSARWTKTSSSQKNKFTVSGRSLVINLPEDLARHMHLAKGLIARIRPVDDRHFIVEVR